ncbi:MauE/DoxX family redox-associated membrane protein [Novosphingobium sp.]|uniref:MauE/DoxX family redox-associated membrane protein n=1 Tax=Novosphingobium sp. TaxID=1874826 RepID=UPI003BAA18E1
MTDGGALTLAALGGTGLGVLGYAGALGVALVFFQAAIPKFQHRDLLAGVVANYRLLPAGLVGPVARMLPLAEMGAAVSLLLIHHGLGAAPAFALLLVFAAAMAINLMRGRSQIDCGCGRSQLRQPLSWLLVARNLVLAALLLPRLVQPQFRLNSITDLAIAMAGGLAVFVIVQLFNAIGALAATPLAASRR